MKRFIKVFENNEAQIAVVKDDKALPVPSIGLIAHDGAIAFLGYPDESTRDMAWESLDKDAVFEIIRTHIPIILAEAEKEHSDVH